MLIIRFGDHNGGIIICSRGVLKCPVVKSRSNSALFYLHGAFHSVIFQDDPAWGTTWGF